MRPWWQHTTPVKFVFFYTVDVLQFNVDVASSWLETYYLICNLEAFRVVADFLINCTDK